MLKKATYLYLLPLLLLLLAPVLVIIILAGKPPVESSAAAKGTNNPQQKADVYYEDQVYHLPAEIAASVDTLNQSAKHPATSTIRLPILLYHYIEPINPKDRLRASLTVTPEKFAEQLALIKQANYESVTISQVALLLASTTAKEKKIALTFDDGYRDFYQYAFPLLQKYKIRATIYVIYDAINSPAYLSEQMIREMLASGLVEIGSHALDHKKLTSLSEAEAKRQIFLSKKMFEERFKTPIDTFAYPYGSFNQLIADRAKSAGYKAAVSVIPGEKQAEANRYFLFRIRSSDQGGGTLLKRLLLN